MKILFPLILKQAWGLFKEKTQKQSYWVLLAEAEGFEPPVPCGTPVFKTGTFDHSVTPPELRDKNTLSDSNTLIKL